MSEISDNSWWSPSASDHVRTPTHPVINALTSVFPGNTIPGWYLLKQLEPLSMFDTSLKWCIINLNSMIHIAHFRTYASMYIQKDSWYIVGVSHATNVITAVEVRPGKGAVVPGNWFD